MKQCPHTGLICDCNDVEAMVNCPHKPELPNIDPEWDDMIPNYDMSSEIRNYLDAVRDQ